MNFGNYVVPFLKKNVFHLLSLGYHAHRIKTFLSIKRAIACNPMIFMLPFLFLQQTLHGFPKAILDSLNLTVKFLRLEEKLVFLSEGFRKNFKHGVLFFNKIYDPLF